MANVFTSDLHFFHKNICKFANRPWLYEDNTDNLIKTWNNNVKPGDTIWHLGDFFFTGANKAQDCIDVLNKLNGTIRCIQGNHDPKKLMDKLLDAGAIETCDKMKEIKLNKVKIVMNHYPMVVWNQSHRGSIQLHGHCHGSLHNMGRSIDVGLDGARERLGAWRFWTEKDVLEYGLALPIHAPDQHEIGGRG